MLRAQEPRDPALGSLEVVEDAVPTLGAGEVAVQVTAALLDPLTFATDPSPQGAFTGVISELGAGASKRLEVGDTVVGVGPPSDLISLPEAEVEGVPADARLDPAQAAAIPYLCSFWQALSAIEIEPRGRVLITGDPVIRHLSEQFVSALLPDAQVTQLDLASPRETVKEIEGSFDLLVHEVADPVALQLGLSALGLDGEAYLLVAPGPKVLPLDFYPNLHRSSLRAFVRRVGSPCRPASCPDPGHARLYELLESRQVDLEPVLSRATSDSKLAGLRLERGGPAQKLLAMAWS